MLTVRSTINISSQTVPPIIPVVQGDTGRAILFTLADFTIPAGATATYYVQKPSGEAVYNNATIDGNNVLVNLTAQSIIEKGDNYGQVRIAVGEDIVTSFDFILLVKEFRGIEAVQSLTEMNIFDKAVEQAADAIDDVKTDALDDMDSAKTAALDDIGDAKDAALQEIEQSTGNFADDFSASATYAAGDYVMHSGQLYRFTANHAAGAWTGSDAEAVTVGEELTDLKAETTDLKDDFHSYHSELGAGYADQLVSSIESEDSVPYNFRKVPYDATLEKVEGIVGVDVVLNQLARNINSSNWRAESGVTATFTDGVVSFSSTTVNYGVKCNTEAVKGNHIYFLAIQAKSASVCTARLFYGGSGGASTNVNCTTSYALTEKIAKAPSSANGGDVYVFPLDDAGLNNQIDAKDIEVVDLTQTFGSQIADYVYSLEQSTAGSGVAWLKQHFSKIFDSGYIPYNAGTLVHVSGLSAKKTVGFNQWDEEYEIGYIGTFSGENTPSTTNIRAKNYIPVLPNTVYYLRTAFNEVVFCPVFFYDTNKNFISANMQTIWNNTVTTPSDACYMRFYMQKNYGTTYNHDICINLSDPAKNGTYEPYEAHTYPLDDSLTLRGIPKLDAQNNLYYDGDEYVADGTVNRRYGVVDLGTLTWRKGSRNNADTGNVFYTSTQIDAKTGVDSGILCPVLVTNPAYDAAWEAIGVNEIRYSSDLTRSLVAGSTATDAESFKSAMSGVMLVYELAEPTTETAEPYTANQICDPNGTEEYISDTIAPVGHVTKYPLDVAGRLDNILSMPSANGTYELRATVASGKVTYSWVSA